MLNPSERESIRMNVERQRPQIEGAANRKYLVALAFAGVRTFLSEAGTYHAIDTPTASVLIATRYTLQDALLAKAKFQVKWPNPQFSWFIADLSGNPVESLEQAWMEVRP